MSEWISIEEGLPEEKGKDYRVVAIAVKKYGLLPDGKECNYHGQGKMGVRQDWVVRAWPQNFTHWMYIPEPPQ